MKKLEQVLEILSIISGVSLAIPLAINILGGKSFRKWKDNIDIEIGYYLLELSEKKFYPQWHTKLKAKLDALFGRDLLSSKAFNVSAIHTVLVIFIITLIGSIFIILLKSEEIIQNGGSIKKSFLLAMATPLSIIPYNLPFNYISVAASRYLINKMEGKNIKRISSLIITDIFISVLLGLLPVGCKILTNMFIYGVIFDTPYTGNGLSVQAFISIAASLITSIYLWFYIFTALANKVAISIVSTFSLSAKWEALIEKPLAVIYVLSIIILCITYVALLMS